MTHFLLHSLSSCTFPCCISLTESAPDAPTLSFLSNQKTRSNISCRMQRESVQFTIKIR